jgi:hypothetical protein
MRSGDRLRGGTLAAAWLAASLCGCGTLNRRPVGGADFQGRGRRPAPTETGACSLAGQELAEVNRQIARLSGSVTTTSAAIQDLRTSRDEAIQTRQSCLDHCNDLSGAAAVKECTATCARSADGPVAAAQVSVASRQQSCQLLLQTIQALNDIRTDLARTCPIRFDARDIPPASACN